MYVHIQYNTFGSPKTSLDCVRLTSNSKLAPSGSDVLSSNGGGSPALAHELPTMQASSFSRLTEPEFVHSQLRPPTTVCVCTNVG